MHEVLVGCVGRYVLDIDPLHPPRTKIQHDVAGNFVQGKVSANRDEIPDGLDPRVAPSAQLIFTLANYSIFRQRPVEFEGALDRNERFGNAAQQSGRFLWRVPLVCYGFDALQQFSSGKLGDLLCREIAIAAPLGQFCSCLKPRLGIIGIARKSSFPGFDLLGPYQRCLGLGLCLGISMEAQPDFATAFDQRKALRDTPPDIEYRSSSHKRHRMLPSEKWSRMCSTSCSRNEEALKAAKDIRV